MELETALAELQKLRHEIECRPDRALRVCVRVVGAGCKDLDGAPPVVTADIVVSAKTLCEAIVTALAIRRDQEARHTCPSCVAPLRWSPVRGQRAKSYGVQKADLVCDACKNVFQYNGLGKVVTPWTKW